MSSRPAQELVPRTARTVTQRNHDSGEEKNKTKTKDMMALVTPVMVGEVETGRSQEFTASQFDLELASSRPS